MQNLLHIKAVVEDCEELNVIAWNSKMYWKYPLDWMERWRKELTLNNEDFVKQQIYKLVLGDKIIGYCAIEEREEEYDITNLWLLPNFISNGYGKFLLTETLRKVVDKQKRIIVEADPNAESFYARQGFKTFDKIESYPKGRFLPLMQKTPK